MACEPYLEQVAELWAEVKELRSKLKENEKKCDGCTNNLCGFCSRHFPDLYKAGEADG